MENLKTKGIFTLLFTVTIFLTLAFGNIFAATEYVPVYLTVKDDNGTTLKTDTTYTTLKAGDKIYVTAHCDHEKALYWSQNSLWMQQKGYKVNDKGMALLGYGFDISAASDFISSSDPTQLVITIPNFAEGSTHTLKIQAVGAIDYLQEGDTLYEAYTGFKMDITIPKTPVALTGDIVASYNGKTLTSGSTTTITAGSKVTISGTPAENFSSVSGTWQIGSNSATAVSFNGASYTLDIPGTEGQTIKLTLTGLLKDGGKTATKTYTFVIPAPTPEPETTISASITKVNDTTLKVTATVENGTFSKFQYHWDSEADKEATSNPLNITIPNFATGTTHTLTVKASTMNGKTVTKTYTVTMPKEETPDVTPETTISISVSKTSDTNIKVTATVENGKFGKFVYYWDNGADQESTSHPLNITIPNYAPGTAHTLTVTGYTENGKKATKSLNVVIPEVETEPEEEDELRVEAWMRENDDAEGLLVSLSNTSEEGKANENFYALEEKVIYYVDYKNCDKDITKPVKIVLTLPLDFRVRNAAGGVVSKSGKTITWTFENGLKEGQAGTKEVTIEYLELSKRSYDYEMVYPVVRIYKDNREEDASAVMNFVYVSESTVIEDTHEPYMFGDAEKATFRPDASISRAEGALVLTRIFGISTSNVRVTNKYSDIGDTYLEAQKAITAASNLGIINGYEDGTYRPNEKMTRAEFMKIIASYVEIIGEEENVDGLNIKNEENIKVYKNSNKRNHWSIPYVTLLVRLNMTPVSSSNKNLRLDDEITRAEVAQFVNFYAFRAPAKITSSTKIVFTDLSKRHELIGDIIEATRDSHEYTITSDGREKVN